MPSSGTIRPTSLATFIGQTAAVKQLRVAIASARNRDVALGHVLLLGPPGVGKTSLGHSVVPSEMGTASTYVNCSAVEKTQDLLSVLTTQKPQQVVFMDEIHALIPPAKEIMLSLLEDSKVTVNIGKDTQKQLLTIDLPRFTVVAATTRPSALSEPLRDRFMHLIQLEQYSDDEVERILQWHFEARQVAAEAGAIKLLAPLCRGTARHAVRLVEACLDTCYAVDAKASKATTVDAQQTLDRLGYKSGLTPQEIKLLIALRDSPRQQLGLSSLAAKIDDDPRNVEDVIEPWLIQTGLIVIETRGRVLTDLGRKSIPC